MGIWGENTAVKRLEDRIAVLEDLCSGLQRDRNKLDLEFTDLYDKVRHQMSRMAKRDAVSSKENGIEPPAEAPNLPFPDADPVSRSILMRRSGQGSKL